MNTIFTAVQAIGFDLDRTLYADVPEMGERIAWAVAIEILKLKPELETIERVMEIYVPECQRVGSWLKVLQNLGLAEPKQIINRCLETADISDLIQPDDRLAAMMRQLSRRFYLFIITGSPRNQSIKKLAKLGINQKLFNFCLFGDDPQFRPKTQPDSYAYFLSQSHFLPEQVAYVGDNRESDIMVPRALGIKTVAVGHTCSEADTCIENIYEIENLFL